MSDQNENSHDKKKSAKALERVTIENAIKEKLNSFESQANESLQGVATVNKSDIVNLILNLHDNQLSPLEIEELRKTHFDIFKCLTWLKNQAKDAKEKGHQVSLKDLMKKSSELMLEQTAPLVKKTRKPRKNKADASDARNDSSPAMLEKSSS